MNGVAADGAVESRDVAMKILILNAGSSSQKSCLYGFEAEALAAPSRPLWEAEIDLTHHQGLAELKVATADGVSLVETLKSESRSEATGHMHLLRQPIYSVDRLDRIPRKENRDHGG
jgi:acetate kinase